MAENVANLSLAPVVLENIAFDTETLDTLSKRLIGACVLAGKDRIGVLIVQRAGTHEGLIVMVPDDFANRFMPAFLAHEARRTAEMKRAHGPLKANPNDLSIKH